MCKLLLIGTGGHFRSVISCLDRTHYTEIALIDFSDSIGQSREGLIIIGSDDDLPALYLRGYRHAFISIGSVGAPTVRQRIYQELKGIGFTLPSIIDKTAIIAEKSRIGEGVFVGKGCILNTGSSVGDCAIINTGSIVEHDTSIGDFCHIATGCCLAGNMKVGPNTHVGIGSSAIQGVNIGENSIIGAGSVVVHDIPANVVAMGIPCQPRRKR